MYETETWLPINGYESLYEVSDQGRIKSLEKVRNVGGKKQTRVYPEKIIKARRLPKKKYLYVSISKEGKVKSFTVHRLVAKAHVPNPENLPVVNHDDTDTFNNFATNLKWTTLSGNSKHAYLNGLLKNAFGNKGIKNPSERPVIDQQNGKIYPTIVEAAKFSPFSLRSLYHQLAGEQRKKTTLNYYQ